MAFITWFIRALVILLVIRLVLRFVRGVMAGSAKGPARRPSRPQERLGGTLARDPQCGTYVAPDGAVTSGSGDNVLYFCSTTCRDAYRSR
jgi:hypothetical protein